MGAEELCDVCVALRRDDAEEEVRAAEETRMPLETRSRMRSCSARGVVEGKRKEKSNVRSSSGREGDAPRSMVRFARFLRRSFSQAMRKEESTAKVGETLLEEDRVAPVSVFGEKGESA